MSAPPPDDALLAVDDLDDLVFRARQVPLTDQVRVDPETYRAIVARIEAHLAVHVADEARGSRRPLTEAVATIRRTIDTAPKLPIGRKVRLDPQPVLDAVDAIRGVLPDAVRRRRAAERASD